MLVECCLTSQVRIIVGIQNGASKADSRRAHQTVANAPKSAGGDALSHIAAHRQTTKIAQQWLSVYKDGERESSYYVYWNAVHYCSSL